VHEGRKGGGSTGDAARSCAGVLTERHAASERECACGEREGAACGERGHVERASGRGGKNEALRAEERRRKK
jgi:hypothetical protein